jgi:hypothetical protein
MHDFYRGYSPLEAGRMLAMGKFRAKVGLVVGGK